MWKCSIYGRGGCSDIWGGVRGRLEAGTGGLGVVSICGGGIMKGGCGISGASIGGDRSPDVEEQLASTDGLVVM